MSNKADCGGNGDPLSGMHTPVNQHAGGSQNGIKHMWDVIQEALGHLGVVSGAPFLPIFTIQMALPSWDKPNLVKISKIFWLFDDLYDEFYDEDNLVFVAKDFYLFQLNYFWMPLTEILQVILFVFLSDSHVRLFFIFDWDPSGIPVCISEICSLLLFHQLLSLTASLC